MLLGDPVEDVQEQAFNVLRNSTELEDGIAMVFKEVGKEVLSCVTAGLSSGSDNVVLLSYPNLLSALQVCLSEAESEVRGFVVYCILELVSKNPRRKKVMTAAGIVTTLKRLCECQWSGHGGTSGGRASTAFISSSMGGVGGRCPERHSGSGGVGCGGRGSWGGSGSMRYMHGSGHSTVEIDEDIFVV